MRERIQGIWSGAQEKLKDFYQDERGGIFNWGAGRAPKANRFSLTKPQKRFLEEQTGAKIGNVLGRLPRREEIEYLNSLPPEARLEIERRYSRRGLLARMLEENPNPDPQAGLLRIILFGG